MCHTVHRSYLGWDITIRCSKRPPAFDTAKAPTYTAMAEAELQLDRDPADWVDPRIQIINTGNRSFETGGFCVEELFKEIKELIDALQRQPKFEP